MVPLMEEPIDTPVAVAALLILILAVLWIIYRESARRSGQNGNDRAPFNDSFPPS